MLKDFLAQYGIEADPEKEEKRLGKMFKESAAAIVVDYGLPMNAEEFGEAIMPLYQERQVFLFLDDFDLIRKFYLFVLCSCVHAVILLEIPPCFS